MRDITLYETSGKYFGPTSIYDIRRQIEALGVGTVISSAGGERHRSRANPGAFPAIAALARLLEADGWHAKNPVKRSHETAPMHADRLCSSARPSSRGGQ